MDEISERMAPASHEPQPKSARLCNLRKSAALSRIAGVANSETRRPADSPPTPSRRDFRPQGRHVVAPVGRCPFDRRLLLVDLR